MSRIHVAALLALSVYALSDSTAFGQVIFAPSSGPSPTSNEGRATDRDDVQHCQAAAGGSRVRENCEVETTTIRAEQDLKLSIKLNAPPVNLQCGATTTTQYQQRNTIARVNGTLEIKDCTVASGTFTVALRTRDESGADKPPLEFSETWQRSDDANVDFTADYPIGENVELVSARLRGLTCTCADLTQDTAESGELAVTPEQPLNEN